MSLETLRDEFAAVALNGLLASWDRGNTGRVIDGEALAELAYALADEMLIVRRSFCPVCQERVDPAQGVIIHKSGCTWGWPQDLPSGEL